MTIVYKEIKSKIYMQNINPTKKKILNITIFEYVFEYPQATNLHPPKKILIPAMIVEISIINITIMPLLKTLPSTKFIIVGVSNIIIEQSIIFIKKTIIIILFTKTSSFSRETLGNIVW